MTDEEKIEQAAAAYEKENLDMYLSSTNFKDGVQWRDQNPKAPEQRIQDIATAKDAYLAALRSPEVLALVDELNSMIHEASDQLRMYTTSYKQEPYDTGFILQLYIHDSMQRISKAREALAAWSKK
jgi:hypothetical protein